MDAAEMIARELCRHENIRATGDMKTIVDAGWRNWAPFAADLHRRIAESFVESVAKAQHAVNAERFHTPWPCKECIASARRALKLED